MVAQNLFELPDVVIVALLRHLNHIGKEALVVRLNSCGSCLLFVVFAGTKATAGILSASRVEVPTVPQSPRDGEFLLSG